MLLKALIILNLSKLRKKPLYRATVYRNVNASFSIFLQFRPLILIIPPRNNIKTNSKLDQLVNATSSLSCCSYVYVFIHLPLLLTPSILSFNLCILGFPLSLLRQYSIDALKELENSLHVHELCFKDTKNILKVFSFVLLLLDKATVEIDPFNLLELALL